MTLVHINTGRSSITTTRIPNTSDFGIAEQSMATHSMQAKARPIGERSTTVVLCRHCLFRRPLVQPDTDPQESSAQVI